MTYAKAIPALMMALLLGACTTPVPMQDSGIATPASWSAIQASPVIASSTEVDQQWWMQFHDPVLDQLISDAITGSKTLAIAKARVDEARASRAIARSALFPNVNLTGTAQRTNQGILTGNRTFNSAETDLQASWELDLFGRNQALTAQATAILQSQEAASQAVRVELLAEVARNYFDLRDDEQQIALTQANLELQQRTLELTRVQFEAGFSSEFDVQRAAAQVSATAALIPALQASYDAALNRLNILLGLPPGTKDPILKTPAPLAPINGRILVAAPAQVMRSRPDLKLAERQFAATISARKAAVAQLFPDISLTALFGVQGATGLGSTPWSLGASFVQPVLNFGRIESQIDVADSQQKQAFLNYQEIVLEALENMEDALSSYQREAVRNDSLNSSVQQDRRAADLAQQQYTGGFSSLLDLLVAQRDLLNAEAAQAQSNVNLRKDLVAIYTAAGGGWQDADETPNQLTDAR